MHVFSVHIVHVNMREWCCVSSAKERKVCGYNVGQKKEGGACVGD